MMHETDGPGAAAGAGDGAGVDPSSSSAVGDAAGAVGSSVGLTSPPGAGSGGPTPRRQASSSSTPTGEVRTDAAPAASPSDRRRISLSSAPQTIPGKMLLVLTILLRIVLWPLRRTYDFLFPLGEYDGLNLPGVSDKAARAFVSHFRKSYLTGPTARRTRREEENGESGGGAGGGGGVGPRDCPFATSGYESFLSDLVSSAADDGTGPGTDDGIGGGGGGVGSVPLALVYVHSPLHPACDDFAARTLADDRVLDYLNGDERRCVKCFGCSIRTADGLNVANSLGVRSYPFVAVLAVEPAPSAAAAPSSASAPSAAARQTPKKAEVHLRMEGSALSKLRPEQFLGYVSTTVRRRRAALAEEERRRLVREEEARLRREQDQEFQEALLADRRRDAERREAEERARREADLAAEAARREAEESERRSAALRALVTEEPPPGAPGSARMRMTLPDGKRIDRRFAGSDKVENVRAFLAVHFEENGVNIQNFSMSTNFPRRTYDDGSVTLREAGLAPQAVIMIQDLDA